MFNNFFFSIIIQPNMENKKNKQIKINFFLFRNKICKIFFKKKLYIEEIITAQRTTSTTDDFANIIFNMHF